MLTDLYELIRRHERKGDFTHAVVTEEMLCEGGKKLGIKIPEEYQSFLKEFGHGGIDGIEAIGVGKNGKMMFEKETLKYRLYGLPNELIVIENCGEWLYCINSDDGKVVMWSKGDNNGYTKGFDNFEAYLYARINDMLENM